MVQVNFPSYLRCSGDSSNNPGVEGCMGLRMTLSWTQFSLAGGLLSTVQAVWRVSPSSKVGVEPFLRAVDAGEEEAWSH